MYLQSKIQKKSLWVFLGVGMGVLRSISISEQVETIKIKIHSVWNKKTTFFFKCLLFFFYPESRAYKKDQLFMYAKQ